LHTFNKELGEAEVCPVEYSKIHTGLNAINKWLSHLFKWGW